MKYFVFLSVLFVIAGCANKEYPNYIGVLPAYAHQLQAPPQPPQIIVPSAPSDSIIVGKPPSFVPVMPEESLNRLKMLLTNKK